jgi:opacity protein-like surface antigen
MMKGITLALAVAGLAAAGGARADDADDAPGFYLGGGVGEYKVTVDDFDDVTTAVERYDSDDTAWKAIAGFSANRYLALELAYVNLGSPEDEIAPDTFVETETDGFAPYIVGTIPVGIFDFFAKAGYYLYETNTRVTSPLGDAHSKKSGDDFTWSLGAGVTLAKAFNVRLEYEQFDFQNTDDSNALWLTGTFRF